MEDILNLILIAAGLADGSSEGLTQDVARETVSKVRESLIDTIPTLLGKPLGEVYNDFTRYSAKNTKLYFDELVAAGFNDEAAIQLTLARVISLREGFQEALNNFGKATKS